MNYISAEQFQEQPKEVQKVLLDWWKVREGDLFLYQEEYNKDPFYTNVNVCNIDLEDNIEGDFKWLKTQVIPLFTEGQLREFIEDKTNCKISVSPSIEGKYYVGYDKYANNEDGDLTRSTYVNDVLSGYWKVACQIAKEVANE